jgi:hypothetical protein
MLRGRLFSSNPAPTFRAGLPKISTTSGSAPPVPNQSPLVSKTPVPIPFSQNAGFLNPSYAPTMVIISKRKASNAGIFPTPFSENIYEARRLVTHGDVLLNGIKVCRK